MKLRFLLASSLFFLASCGSLETIDGQLVNNDLISEAIFDAINNVDDIVSINMKTSAKTDESVLYGGLAKGVTIQEETSEAKVTAYENNVIEQTASLSKSENIDGAKVSQGYTTTTTVAYTEVTENSVSYLTTVSKVVGKNSSDPYSSTSYSMGSNIEATNIEEIMQDYFNQSIPTGLRSTDLYKVSGGYRFYTKVVQSSTIENALYPNDTEKNIPVYSETIVSADVTQHDKSYRLNKILLKATGFAKVNYLGDTLKDAVIVSEQQEVTFTYGNKPEYKKDIPTKTDYETKANNSPTLTVTPTDTAQFTQAYTDYSNNYQALTGKSKYLYRYEIDISTNQKYTLKIGSAASSISSTASLTYNESDFVVAFANGSFTIAEQEKQPDSVYLDVLVDMETNNDISIVLHYSDESITKLI